MALFAARPGREAGSSRAVKGEVDAMTVNRRARRPAGRRGIRMTGRRRLIPVTSAGGWRRGGPNCGSASARWPSARRSTAGTWSSWRTSPPAGRGHAAPAGGGAAHHAGRAARRRRRRAARPRGRAGRTARAAQPGGMPAAAGAWRPRPARLQHRLRADGPAGQLPAGRRHDRAADRHRFADRRRTATTRFSFETDHSMRRSGAAGACWSAARRTGCCSPASSGTCAKLATCGPGPPESTTCTSGSCPRTSAAAASGRGSAQAAQAPSGIDLAISRVLVPCSRLASTRSSRSRSSAPNSGSAAHRARMAAASNSNASHRGDADRAERPPVRREQPGAAEQVPDADAVDDDPAAPGHVHVQGDMTGLDQPELAGEPAVVEDPVPGGEHDVRRRRGERVQLARRHARRNG